MKNYVYDRRKDEDYEFPKDMEKILGYLRDNGNRQVTGKTVERLYREFSHKRGAGWLSPCDPLIKEFADWLDELIADASLSTIVFYGYLEGGMTMKVYSKKRDFAHSEDMEKILKYLCIDGNLQITRKDAERLYREFSAEHGTSLLAASDETIKEFGDWLIY